MVNYQNSKIYKLTCDNPELVYYGSTTQRLSDRLSGHKKNWKYGKTCKSRLLFDVGNVKIELLEKCPCNDKEELNAIETEWIRQNPCVNKCIPGRTMKEYLEDNKEKLREQRKKYRELNKEVIREKKKEYYIDNKEKIREKNKEKITCQCGSIVRKSDLKRHMRTQKHIRCLEAKKDSSERF